MKVNKDLIMLRHASSDYSWNRFLELNLMNMRKNGIPDIFPEIMGIFLGIFLWAMFCVIIKLVSMDDGNLGIPKGGLLKEAPVMLHTE